MSILVVSYLFWTVTWNKHPALLRVHTHHRLLKTNFQLESEIRMTADFFTLYNRFTNPAGGYSGLKPIRNPHKIFDKIFSNSHCSPVLGTEKKAMVLILQIFLFNKFFAYSIFLQMFPLQQNYNYFLK